MTAQGSEMLQFAGVKSDCADTCRHHLPGHGRVEEMWGRRAFFSGEKGTTGCLASGAVP